jgi:hypothetical protein
MSPSKNPIVWDVAGLHLNADPAATIALDRSAWETAGARFTAADDGHGEAPGLALAQLKTAKGQVTVGIVDYDSDSTYLLVPGEVPTRSATTRAVLEILDAEGVIDRRRDILDTARVPDASTLLARIARLEEELRMVRASGRSKSAGDRLEAPPSAKAGSAGQRATGTVTFLDRKRGYGYITPDDGGADVFFTASDVIPRRPGRATSPEPSTGSGREGSY